MRDFKSAISQFKSIPSQEEALLKLASWYHSDSPWITLTGRAGTGKTYIINRFIEEIVRCSFCISAPTHKALRQVEKATNRKGKTIQSLHGLRPNYNLDSFNLDNVLFDMIGIPKIQDYKLLIIDECGMVGNSLHELNLKRGADVNCKILYIGDILQVPPISKENDNNVSPTFNTPDLITLTEVVRQGADNPMLDLLEVLANDASTGKFTSYSFLKDNLENVKNGKGYKVIKNKEEFKEIALECFKSDTFSNNPDYARIAAWKNDTVLSHNIGIRNSISPLFNGRNGIIELIDKNDLLIGYKTIVSKDNDLLLINSEDYILADVTSRECDYKFKVYSCQLKTRFSNKVSFMNIVDYRDKSFLIYYEHLKKLYYNAYYANSNKGAAWKKFYEFKDNYLSLITFPIKDGEKIKTTVSKDIDYGFALTIHKLQGSTINTILVDVEDLLFYSNGGFIKNSSYNKNAELMRNKLLYTAVSRASDMAYIYLPDKIK